MSTLTLSLTLQVVEHAGDYTEAVRVGREAASKDPLAHFVDGETSLDLILGYSTAAFEIVRQLDQRQVSHRQLDPREGLVGA